MLCSPVTLGLQNLHALYTSPPLKDTHVQVRRPQLPQLSPPAPLQRGCHGEGEGGCSGPSSGDSSGCGRRSALNPQPVPRTPQVCNSTPSGGRFGRLGPPQCKFTRLCWCACSPSSPGKRATWSPTSAPATWRSASAQTRRLIIRALPPLPLTRQCPPGGAARLGSTGRMA